MTDQADYLRSALESLPEAIAVFDASERFVFWNRQFSTVYAAEGVDIQVGMTFEDHLRQAVAAGLVKDALGREEAWVAERLLRFRTASGSRQHQLANGRWLHVQDTRMSNGGTVGIRTDITEHVSTQSSLRLLFEANSTAMFLHDRFTLQMTDVNQAALELYGYSREEFLQLHLTDIRPESEPGQIAAMIDRLHDPEIAAIPRIHFTKAGTELHVRVRGRLMEVNGRPTILAAVFDMTKEILLQKELTRSQHFLQMVLDQIPVAVWVKDMEDGGKYVVYNKANEKLYECPREPMPGGHRSEPVRPFLTKAAERTDWEALMAPAAITVEQTVAIDGVDRVLQTRKTAISDGSTRRYVIGVSEDLTERRRDEARVAFMAHHDALTQLPNRYLFEDRMGSALALLDTGDKLMACLLVDLDGFKGVNDRLGHGAGDKLLQGVATRIRKCIRHTDTAARLGGDEFAVIMAPIDKPRDAIRLAQRLTASLSAPYAIEGQDVRISASIGISIADTSSTEAKLLIAEADAALYQAKSAGRDCYRLSADTGQRSNCI